MPEWSTPNKQDYSNSCRLSLFPFRNSAVKPIDRIPQIGEKVFYRCLNDNQEEHTVVEPQKPSSDGIIWIQDSAGKVDSIIALFPNGDYNTRLSF